MDNGKKKPITEKITVKYSKFKKIITVIEKMNLTNDDEISFEFIVGSCFPKVLDNIKKELAYQYTKGYIDGLANHNDKEKEA